MTSRPLAGSSVAARARAALLDLLVDHDARGGVGPDAYCDVPMVHPMAEGRFLSAMAAAVRARVLSPARMRVMAGRSVARLEAMTVPFCAESSGDGIGWGLGFAYKNSPVTEPYMVTSAMVSQGLAECAALLDRPHEPLTTLRDQALAALRHWCRTTDRPNAELGISLPAYAPHVRQPIANAAILALGVLLAQDCALTAAEAEAWRARLRQALDLRWDGLGWPDVPDSGVIDLMHQAVIISGFSAALPADDAVTAILDLAAIETLGQFAIPGGFLDTMRRLDGPPALPLSARQIVRRVGDAYVAVRLAPARLWSLGEFLAALADRATHDPARLSERRENWRLTALPVVEATLAGLASGPEAGFPRHRMIAAYGLARYLAMAQSMA